MRVDHTTLLGCDHLRSDGDQQEIAHGSYYYETFEFSCSIACFNVMSNATGRCSICVNICRTWRKTIEPMVLVLLGPDPNALRPAQQFIDQGEKEVFSHDAWDC